MTNKILLAAIALGLWANASVSYMRPARAETDSLMAQSLGGIEGRLAVIGDMLSRIESDLNHIAFR